MNLKHLIGKIFIQDENGKASKAPRPTDGTIHRQQLLDEIYNHFISRFYEETTCEGMLFPTSFCIYLHEKDYQKQEQTFGFTAKEAVNMFHRFLKEKQLNSYPNYVPHSTYWLFQFSKYTEGNLIEGFNEHLPSIQVGQPITVSSIFAVDFTKVNIANETNIRATVHNKRSDTMQELNLNRDAFLGMEMDAKDRFRFDFSKNFDKVAEASLATVHSAGSNVLATLRCDANFIGADGKAGNVYYVTTEWIEISGKNDNRQAPHIVRLNSDSILDSHIQIKYIPQQKLFKLAAFEDQVILNERKILKSTGGDVNWINLPNNSSIFLNAGIQINFLINK